MRERVVCERAPCHKCHACHSKCTPMSPSATHATQSAGRCHQVPRLPHKVKPTSTCHQVSRLPHKASPGTKRATRGSQPRAVSATPFMQIAGRCHLPHKVKVGVAKCHACHTKWSGVTVNQARHWSEPGAVLATLSTQTEGRCHQVPRLPHKRKVDVTKFHASHTK